MGGGRAMLSVKHVAAAHNSRNRVFEDQLFLAVVFKQHGILVKGANLSGELDSTDQVNCDGGFVLADSVQVS
jgi:hypothetical protein